MNYIIIIILFIKFSKNIIITLDKNLLAFGKDKLIFFEFYYLGNIYLY